MTGIKSNRTFKVWDYRVSHSQLLLRSPKDDEHCRNHDVLFVGVERLNIPMIFKGLEVATGGSANADQLSGRECATTNTNHTFTLTSGDQRYVVIAVAMRDEQNDLDIFDSSLESFEP